MTTVLLHTAQTAPKMERTQPKVQVVRGGRHGLNRARQLASSTLSVLAVALLLGLVVSVVYSQARITELNGEINDTKTQLTAAQSEYDYLSTQMSNITSRTNLQQVAEGQLGLVPLDPSQVTYVQLEDQSVIEKSTSSAELLLSDVRTAISEAVTNAIIHGYENRSGMVHLRCTLEGDLFTATVRDDGVGIRDIEQARQPFFTTRPELERSGMGFTVMEAFMEEVVIESVPGQGTSVTMKKRIARRDGA